MWRGRSALLLRKKVRIRHLVFSIVLSFVRLHEAIARANLVTNAFRWMAEERGAYTESSSSAVIDRISEHWMTVNQAAPQARSALLQSL